VTAFVAIVETLIKQQLIHVSKEELQGKEKEAEKKIKKGKKQKEGILTEEPASGQILELIREGAPALVMRMKDCVDIIRKELYDLMSFIISTYECTEITCSKLDIEEAEFQKQVLDTAHDSGRYCQIAALHLV